MTEARAWKLYLATRDTPRPSARAERFLLDAYDHYARITAARFAPESWQEQLLDAEDRLVVVRIALLIALRRFEPARIKFSSFAIGIMRNALREAWRKTDVTAHSGRLMRRRIDVATSSLQQEGVMITDETVAARMGSTAPVVRQTNAAPASFGALDALLDSGEETYHDLPQHSVTMDGMDLYADPAILCDRTALREPLARALQLLTARDRAILQMRAVDNWTLQETGDSLGLSRERIRQIEAKMMPRLRETLSVDAHEHWTPV